MIPDVKVVLLTVFALSASFFTSVRAECTTVPELCGVQAAFGGSLIMPQVIPNFVVGCRLHPPLGSYRCPPPRCRVRVLTFRSRPSYLS